MFVSHESEHGLELGVGVGVGVALGLGVGVGLGEGVGVGVGVGLGLAEGVGVGVGVGEGDGVGVGVGVGQPTTCVTTTLLVLFAGFVSCSRAETVATFRIGPHFILAGTRKLNVSPTICPVVVRGNAEGTHRMVLPAC